MSDNALLSLDAVTLGYTSSPVVRNLNLTVRNGEVVTLLGPNGAGKTTTLRAISRLIEPMGGAILFEGQDLAGRSPVQVARAGLVQMSDSRSIFRRLTVEEHFRLRYRGQAVDRDVAYQYFPALQKLARRRAGLLSGGEQQMLGLGRALARRRNCSWWTSSASAWPPSLCSGSCPSSAATPTTPVPVSCSSSSTSRWHCPSPTADTCWSTATPSCKAKHPSC